MNYFDTIYTLAKENKKAELEQLLASKKICIDESQTGTLFTATAKLTSENNKVAVERLLSLGANIIKAAQGAALGGHRDYAETLRTQHGANVNAIALGAAQGGHHEYDQYLKSIQPKIPSAPVQQSSLLSSRPPVITSTTTQQSTNPSTQIQQPLPGQQTASGINYFETIYNYAKENKIDELKTLLASGRTHIDVHQQGSHFSAAAKLASENNKRAVDLLCSLGASINDALIAARANKCKALVQALKRKQAKASRTEQNTSPLITSTTPAQLPNPESQDLITRLTAMEKKVSDNEQQILQLITRVIDLEERNK